jgi:hypothetical protein
LTNSFVVSFSSNAWSTAAFIYLFLPLGDFIFFGYGAVAISTKEVSKGYAKPLTS